MALITLHSSRNTIQQNTHQRFDAKYFVMQDFFARIAEQYNLNVQSLKSLNVGIASGSYIPNYTTKDAGIPYIRVADIKPFNLDENEEDLAFVEANVDENIKIQEYDVLIARTQATTDKLGTAALADTHSQGWATSQHITRITANPAIISPLFLVAYCNSKFFKSQMALASQGDTRVEFTHSQLAEVLVVIPHQDRYNDVIRHVETITDNNRQATVLLNEAKQMFLSALAIPNLPIRQSYFSSSLQAIADFDIWNPTAHTPFLIGLEKHLATTFPNVFLGEIADICKGDEVGSDSYDTYLNKHTSDYAFIRTSDVLNHEIDLFPDYFVRESIGNTVAQDLRPGDILFTKDGKIAQTAMVTDADRAIIASGIARIRLHSKQKEPQLVTQEYLFTALSIKETGYYPARRRTVIGTTIPHLRTERLKNIRIPLLDKVIMGDITQKVRQAFQLKTLRKQAIQKVLALLNTEYDTYTNAL